MFYSHTYLKKNGRFGLIWLSATQSKVLSKRELYSVNIKVVCSDILAHFPAHGGHAGDKFHRHKRFSLYLSSQLMIGTVRILQKQSDYLLADSWVLFRKCCPEIPRAREIDLVVLRHEPTTLECLVPSSIKDKNYNIFFGLCKEPDVDVETILEQWDNSFCEKYVPLSPIPNPVKIQAEIGSPHSVSDPKEIQIQEQVCSPVDPMIPGEEDLPHLDIADLTLLQHPEGQTQDVMEIASHDVSRILPITETSFPEVSHSESRLPVFEETPAVHPHAEPRTPRKTKRVKRHDSPTDKTKKRKGDQEVAETSPLRNETATVDLPHHAVVEGREDRQPVAPAEEEAVPETSHSRKPKWAENLPFKLPTITPSPSPIRKPRPHKLVIDETLQITRGDIKQNMITSKSTCQTLVLPSPAPRDLMKQPGSRGLDHPILKGLWKKNCQFRLRYFESDTDSDSISSSLQLHPATSTGRKRKLDLEETEEHLSKRSELSIERGRDAPGRSSSFTGDNRSHSLVAQQSDESHTSEHRSVPDMDRTFGDGLSVSENVTINLGTLPVWPEEQEQIISPVPLEPVALPDTKRGSSVESQHSPPAFDSSPADFMQLLKSHITSRDDWTTFRALCPTETTSRVKAAAVFMDLCEHVGSGTICVRQDEPYAEIFLWLFTP
ncbi:meiotic recombination protein REC8 homolog [Aplysia californica]|uniref:Meiotic recombination protein REC8 homolog n=1 Tax=Aplysia californica TaxID=6500 RepID=A0ABM0JQ39_APLCA|nr:meiotic recombination protein REC8 homolog [Aplysia californica]